VKVFLVVNTSGHFWNGFGWSEQGRTFLSIAQATRSLHEEGESTDGKLMLSADYNDEDPQ
jgi:hypothetical protein